MDAVSDAMNITRITGVPERGEMAEVGARGEEELKRDILWGGRMIDKDMGSIMGSDSGA